MGMKDNFDKDPNAPRIDEMEVYKTVMEMKNKSRAWSVASLVVSIFSVICCCTGWAGIVLGAIGILFAIISRRSIGYFDNLSIAGLIIGIFGVVFGVSAVIISYTFENSPYYEEYLKMLEEMLEEEAPTETLTPSDGGGTEGVTIGGTSDV